MPLYKYEVRQSNGQPVAGSIEAENLTAASTALRQGGNYVVSLTPTTSAGEIVRKLAKISIQAGPGLKEVLAFTNQLSVMIKAGISIRNAIEGIAAQT